MDGPKIDLSILLGFREIIKLYAVVHDNLKCERIQVSLRERGMVQNTLKNRATSCFEYLAMRLALLI
jgi:hypothetical protein